MVFAGPACDWIFEPKIDCQVCGLDRACHGRNFGAPFCKGHGVCWACLWQNFRTADFQVCGLDWACRGWNFGTPFCKAHGLGPASDKIFVLQIAKFVVLTGPAAAEILELHSVRFMVFAGPASDRIFVQQISRFVVLTGPAADEILELHFVRLMVLGLPVTKFSYCRLPSLWSWLGLPRIKFWNSIL